MNNKLRNTLGVMGVILPLLILISLCTVPQSISATYYTQASVFIIGIVTCVGVCLLQYDGYDVTDKWLATVGGVGALLLVLCPCDVGVRYNAFNIPVLVSNIVHLMGAGVFFLAMIIISVWQFTKTKELKPTGRKLKRNVLYVTCGIVMGAALIWGFTIGQLFIGESIALWAFGLSWLTKGGMILKDV